MYFLSPEAVEDLSKTLLFIHERNPWAADNLCKQVAHVFEMLASGQMEGRRVVLRTRQVVQRQYVHPFIVYYQRTSSGDVHILRCYHYARTPIEIT